MTRRESAESARYGCSDIVMDAVPSLCKRHRLPRRLHCDLTACQRSSWRVDKFSPRCHGVLRAFIRRPYTAFVMSMYKRNADPSRSRISHGVSWRYHRVATALVAFVPRSPRRSAFFWNAVIAPPWCDRISGLGLLTGRT